MKIKFHVIIPARYSSLRLPAKVLLDIGGKSMIQHVYERSLKSGALSVTIATDDERVKRVVENFGATVCLTATTHQSGTERIAEAVKKLGFDEQAIVVNVQGDQPLVISEMIIQVAESLATHPEVGMATVCAKLIDREDLFNSNIVKAVIDKNQHALYFSRATIPWDRDSFLEDLTGKKVSLDHYYHHMGLYAYRVNFIKRYLSLTPSPLETIEALEQLRVLWNGERIYVTITDKKIFPEVNTLEDLIAVRKLNADVSQN